MGRLLIASTAVLLLALSACGGSRTIVGKARRAAVTPANFTEFVWSGFAETHNLQHGMTVWNDRQENACLPDPAANPPLNVWVHPEPGTVFYGTPAAHQSVFNHGTPSETWFYHLFVVGKNGPANTLYDIDGDTGALMTMTPHFMANAPGWNLSSAWAAAPANGPWSILAGVAPDECEVAALTSDSQCYTYQKAGSLTTTLEVGNGSYVWAAGQPNLQWQPSDHQFGSPISSRGDWSDQGPAKWRYWPNSDPLAHNSHNYIWTGWKEGEGGGYLYVMAMADPLDHTAQPDYSRPCHWDSYCYRLRNRNSASTPAIVHWDPQVCPEGIALLITVPVGLPNVASLEAFNLDSTPVIASNGAVLPQGSSAPFAWYNTPVNADMPLISPVVIPYSAEAVAPRVFVSTPGGVRVYTVSNTVTPVVSPLLLNMPPLAGEVASMPCPMRFNVNPWLLAWVEQVYDPQGNPFYWQLRVVQYIVGDTYVNYWVSAPQLGRCRSQPVHNGNGWVYVNAGSSIYAFQPYDTTLGTPGPAWPQWISSAVSASGANRSSIAAPVISGIATSNRMYVASPEGNVFQFKP